MKNLILSAAVLLTVSFSAAASTVEPGVNDKAQITFSTLFKKTGKVTWSNAGSNYEAYFENDGIKTRATIDTKGNLLQTIRYYGAHNLPANVLYSVKSDYRGKEIYGVTEVSNKYGINYRIVLIDSKKYTYINADDKGNTEFVDANKRGDK